MCVCRDIRECLKLDQDHKECHTHYKVSVVYSVVRGRGTWENVNHKCCVMYIVAGKEITQVAQFWRKSYEGRQVGWKCVPFRGWSMLSDSFGAVMRTLVRNSFRPCKLNPVLDHLSDISSPNCVTVHQR